MHPQAIFYPNKKNNLVGGLIYGSMIFNEISLQHQFQIINNGMNLMADGIIGCDFLNRFGSVIDFLNSILKINIPRDHPIYDPDNKIVKTEAALTPNTVQSDQHVIKKLDQNNEQLIKLKTIIGSTQSTESTNSKLQMANKKQNSSQSVNFDQIIEVGSENILADQTVPAYSQSILKISTPYDGKFICKKKMLKNNILVGDTIIKSVNKVAHVSVLNTCGESVTITNDEAFGDCKPLSNFKVV